MVKAIEKSVIGVRTAIYDLEHPESGRKLRMFGMIHAATPEYYMEIQRELDDCDVVFYEGVRSRVVRWITLAYRIPTWFLSRTGLAYQGARIDLGGGHRKRDGSAHEGGTKYQLLTTEYSPINPSRASRSSRDRPPGCILPGLAERLVGRARATASGLAPRVLLRILGRGPRRRVAGHRQP